MEDKNMFKLSNFLLMLCICTLFFASMVVIITSRTQVTEYNWKVINKEGQTELFLEGNDLVKVLGADVYLLSSNASSASLGDFYSNVIKVRWDDEIGQYSFFANPTVENEINTSMPLLTKKGEDAFTILPNSLIYIKEKGGVYPKIK